MKPAPTTSRRFTRPATFSSGNRVARNALVVPKTSASRYEALSIALAVSCGTSASGASVSVDSGSNGANAPPVERDRTDSQRPGVPNPRIPNWESWAATVAPPVRAGPSRTRTTTQATRVMVVRTGSVARR